MDANKKVVLTEREKKLFDLIKQKEEIKFRFTRADGNDGFFISWVDSAMQEDRLRSFEKKQQRMGEKINDFLTKNRYSFEEFENLFKKFKGSSVRDVVGGTMIRGNIFFHSFPVDKAISENMGNEANYLNKDFIFNSLENFLSGELDLKVLTKNKIKFFIKANDESINSGDRFKIRIGHSSYDETFLWGIGEEREECARKAQVLQKLFNDREFSVIEDPLGSSETTIIKDSPLSESLKKRITDSMDVLNGTTPENRNDQWMDDNKIVKIGDEENNLYIDVTSEVSEIIKAERNENKEQVEVKIDAEHFRKIGEEQRKKVQQNAEIERERERERENAERERENAERERENAEREREREREMEEIKNLKFNLNFLQKIIGKIVEFISVLLHIRTKNDEKYDANKINSASDLKNLRGESKTWADQMKFDSIFDAFIERNSRPVRS